MCEQNLRILRRQLFHPGGYGQSLVELPRRRIEFDQFQTSLNPDLLLVQIRECAFQVVLRLPGFPLRFSAIPNSASILQRPGCTCKAACMCGIASA